jgi:tRNA G37 N-methylase TrmD
MGYAPYREVVGVFITFSFSRVTVRTYIYKTCGLQGWKVPEVLTSGNFAKIDKWKDGYEHTKTRRLIYGRIKKTALKLVFQHLETLYKINFKL